MERMAAKMAAKNSVLGAVSSPCLRAGGWHALSLRRAWRTCPLWHAHHSSRVDAMRIVHVATGRAYLSKHRRRFNQAGQPRELAELQRE